MRIDSTTNEYLCAIYRIASEEGVPVTGRRLAREFRVSAARVSAKLKRLESRGLVLRRSRFALTASGQARAEELIRRQRLVECLLARWLDVPWAQIFSEASAIKHAISGGMEQHLIASLGGPLRSPFGYPIPGLGQEQLSTTSLAQVEAGERVRVERISESDAALLTFCFEEGIVPGAELLVVEHEPDRGTLSVETDTAMVVIGLQRAEQIWLDLLTAR